MARDSSGTHNQPHYAGTGAPADAADMTEIADYAATVGNSKTGTTTAMNALAGADVWEGLIFGNTTDGFVYKYTSGAFVNIQSLGDTGTVTPTLGNSWVAVGSGFKAPTYRLRGGLVVLSGTMRSGTVSNPVFTLPAGSRPLTTLRFLTESSGPGGAQIDILNTGVVQVAQYVSGGSNLTVGLDGIVFFAEQ